MCYTYKILSNSWFLSIIDILQYIHDFLVKYVCTLPDGAMIRELCLQLDNNNYTLFNSDLSNIIYDPYIS